MAMRVELVVTSERASPRHLCSQTVKDDSRFFQDERKIERERERDGGKKNSEPQ
jgi:hypothetical protein